MPADDSKHHLSPSYCHPHGMTKSHSAFVLILVSGFSVGLTVWARPLLTRHISNPRTVACNFTDTFTMTEKNQDYKERYKEWREISVTQLSTTNNILLTISAGLLAFCFDKEIFKKITIDTTQSICWTHFFYAASIISLAISMTFGIGVLFTRLYDFRISRHLALTRKRLYSKKQALLPDNDLGDINWCDRINGIFRFYLSNYHLLRRLKLTVLKVADN